MARDKNTPDSEFIERMNHLAEKLGSVTALARKAGLSQSGMRRYFEGGEPSRPQLIAIAKAADVSVNWLFTGEEERKPDTAINHLRLPNKSMREMAAWINQQNDGIDYWEVAKAKMATEFPEFREWLKKRQDPTHDHDKER